MLESKVLSNVTCPVCEKMPDLKVEEETKHLFCYHCEIYLHIVWEWSLTGCELLIKPSFDSEMIMTVRQTQIEIDDGLPSAPLTMTDPPINPENPELNPSVFSDKPPPDSNSDEANTDSTLQAWVKFILRQVNGKRAERSEIQGEIIRLRGKCSDNGLGKALNSLCETGEIVRLRQGLYALEE